MTLQDQDGSSQPLESEKCQKSSSKPEESDLVTTKGDHENENNPEVSDANTGEADLDNEKKGKKRLSPEEEEEEREKERVAATKRNRLQVRLDDEQFRELVQDHAMSLPDTGLVVSGLAGRFPQSDSVAEFEQNLYEGVDMVSDQDESRFECGLWGLPPRAGRLKDLSRFDSEFFGFNLDEANFIDFQLRILYEVVYESMLDAGLNPADLRGSNTGVFFGLHCNEFENAMADEPAFKSNGYYAQFAVKVAQYFDLRGLTVTFDAACASGFVGFHNAVEALSEGLIDQAIVCSSNIPVHPTGSFIFLQMQMLSPTGNSRFLDSRADGYVKSEACCSLVLQRKDAARRRYASIMASMTSVDGFKKEGITFPSDASQERLIRAAKQLAGISTNHVEYLEAHGTGTPAGDPQEARAITGVYFPDSAGFELESEQAGFTKQIDRNKVEVDLELKSQISPPEVGHEERRLIGPLLVGSVKTNMGHSEAASGLCALTKVVLMLENELIYKGLQYEQPNTNIEALMDGRLQFVDENRKLRAKIVPLSCYGFGGSNVHVIMRASDQPAIGSEEELSLSLDETDEDRKWTDRLRLVLAFGRNERAVSEFLDQLVATETRQTRHCISDDFLSLVNSLSRSKIDRKMCHRGFVIVDRWAKDPAERVLARSIKPCELNALSDSTMAQLKSVDFGRKPHPQECQPRLLILVFPGAGSQWLGMGAGLRHYAPFWSTIERLSQLLDPFKEDKVDLIGVLTDTSGRRDSNLAELFVGIVAFEIALINLVRDQVGVCDFRWILGHSLGELGAAHSAGILSERQTIMVALQMGLTLDRMLEKVAGKMVALSMSEQEAEQLCLGTSSLEIACVNGPESVTISGRSNELNKLMEHLRNEREPGELAIMEIPGLPVALHNQKVMNEDVNQQLRLAIEKVLFPLSDFDRKSSKWHPSSTGECDQANAQFFADSLCQQVRFGPNLEAALEQVVGSDCVCLELGPSGLFESQIRAMSSSVHYVKLMKRNLPSSEQPLELLRNLGTLFQAGLSLDLEQVHHPNRKPGQICPARRGTPSLSSLWRWDHSEQLFVPRYPQQFSKSSAKTELPVDILQERDKYLSDHCVEGRILYPATGYLFLIWRVFSFTKRQIYDACFHDVEKELLPVEFYDVQLQRAVILASRAVQVYVHYEESTGRFEIKEGSSVIVTGYVRSPQEKPHGMLYDQVREQLQAENLQLSLTSDDVYKQFRVNGYDYGESFRNIIEASQDGRYSRVKFNGHFVALTDSILQSILLTIAQFTPSGGLFLPTRFEYVRFQPELILAKLKAANMKIDLSDGALSTKEKREIMTKIMQREHDAAQGIPVAPETDNRDREKNEEEENNKPDETAPPECIFDTYCDPITGIIVTDGIEMRGIKASPAPRRFDNTSDVLMECLQFIKNVEEPIEDEPLTCFRLRQWPYARVCDSLAAELLAKLLAESGSSKNEQLLGQLYKAYPHLLPMNKVEEYARAHLESSASFGEPQKKADENVGGKELNKETVGLSGVETEPEVVYSTTSNSFYDSSPNCEKSSSEDDAKEKSPKTSDKSPKETDQKEIEWDIKKNGPMALLSILDKLWSNKEGSGQAKEASQLVADHRIQLMRDLTQAPMAGERFMRPLIELVIESCCQKKLKLKVCEVNPDDGILKDSLDDLMQLMEPSLTVDYHLAHPEPARLAKVSAASAKAKTITLKDPADLLTDSQLRDLDLVIFKDPSCYTLPKRQLEHNGLEPVLSSLAKSTKPGGFVLVQMRRHLTLAERVVVALADPQLVGLTEQELAEIVSLKVSPSTSESALRKLEQINELLESRFRSMLAEADRKQLECVARKSDPNGCSVLLFRSPLTRALDPTALSSSTGQAASGGGGTNTGSGDEHPSDELSPEWLANRLVLLVDHDQPDEWLEKLKAQFPVDQSEEEKSDNPEVNESIKTKEDDTAPTEQVVEPVNRVWLCAVANKSRPISGLIGMFQALRKELGSSRLRCYHDEFTFRHQENPVTEEQLLATPAFQRALDGDLLWNCLDGSGNWGAFRHLTICDHLSYEQCRTGHPDLDHLKAPPSTSGWDKSKELSKVSCGSFVNNATKGDLSSFTWFEAPLRHLTAKQQLEELCRISYSALNFRDIMLATGRLPLDAIPLRLALNECLLGLEFSGYDGRGRRVMGMVSGCAIATQVLCPERASIKMEIPDWLSLRDAATIPCVYATAVMALIYRGKMQPGESVLIHAGSGGVGQAAIRLALHFRLRVFTTCSSAEKRRFLMDQFGELGLRECDLFSSRDCNFEARVMEATGGRGVDLVLNSLADEKLQASVRCLAEGGRFLEIGKYDMSTNALIELELLNTNKSFHGILLDKLFDIDDIKPSFRSQLECVVGTIKRGLEQGFVKPINSTLFKRNEIEKAFRLMASGKHIGKVLVEIQPEVASDSTKGAISAQIPTQIPTPIREPNAVPRWQVHPERAHLVTGGLGGFGIELVKWLVKRGARYLVLTSRSGIRTGYQRATLAALEKNAGAHFKLVLESEADASTLEGACRLLDISRSFSPGARLGGIFHLAMVLKDSLLGKLTPSDFELVVRPKLRVGLHLDEALTKLNLESDHFVCFSSVSSAKGNAGQSNYAYANSYLERLCERRRQRNVSGLAIQWGAIGDVGVAFENLGGNNVVIGGTIPQRIPSCMATLSRLLCAPYATCLSVVPVNRKSDLAADKTDLVAAIFHVLGIKDSSKVADSATLGELGLDSLMAVEIRQYIEREYDMSLNIQEIRALTIAKIRDISENGKPSKVKLTAQSAGSEGQNANEPRQAASYGTKLEAATSKTPTKNTGDTDAYRKREKVLPSKRLPLPDRKDPVAFREYLKRDLVSSFVPELELPQEHWRRLNFRREAIISENNSNISGSRSPQLDGSTDRPLFFLPPVHGQFSHLELVGGQLTRPCFGLNWTHRLSGVHSLAEVAEHYLELLEKADWGRDFGRPESPPPIDGLVEGVNRKVDLVGYSYGATVAFEMQLALHRSLAGTGRRFRNLIPGSLVLLDGSPKQLEVGSAIIGGLTRENPMSELEKLDQLLMVFMLAHTKHRDPTSFDLLQFQRRLRALDRGVDKVQLAASELANQLGYPEVDANDLEDGGKARPEVATINNKKAPQRSRNGLMFAMEAFCRRYQMVHLYKAPKSELEKLPGDCVLVRAEQVFLGSEEQTEIHRDLELSSVVKGKVHLFVMRGDHETFINANFRQIGKIIDNYCGHEQEV